MRHSCPLCGELGVDLGPVDGSSVSADTACIRCNIAWSKLGLRRVG